MLVDKCCAGPAESAARDSCCTSPQYSYARANLVLKQRAVVTPQEVMVPLASTMESPLNEMVHDTVTSLDA